MSDFNNTYGIITENEGKGITNHKSDKGGITNSGLTYPFYAERCEVVFNIKPSMLHFRALSEDAKKALYFHFWVQLGVEQINSDAIAAFIFDFAVNSGQAIRVVQETLKSTGVAPNIIVDNVLGSQTISLINSINVNIYQAKWFLAELQLARFEYLWNLGMKDKGQRVFWAGWFKRVLLFPIQFTKFFNKK
jgi:lysozyme family protein